MILYIVRHGNTFDTGDVVTRVGGRTDIPLSVSGQAQADNLAIALQNIKIDQCFSSPLLRTMQTAQTICAKHNIAIQSVDFLREIDYGPDENRPESDVVERLGKQAIIDWDQASVVPQGWIVNPKSYIEAWYKFCSNLNAETSLVVTSNGVARFLLEALSLQPKNLKLKTGSVGKLVKMQDEWTLQYWGERPPLP